MKNIIFIILLAFAFIPFANAEEAKAPEPEVQEPLTKGFDLTAILTLSPMDCFYRMPPSQFLIKHVEKAYRGENFRYLPILTDIVENDGDAYAFECSLSIFKDGFDGGVVLMDKKRIEGVMANKNNVLFFPMDLFLEFSPTDDFGTYNIIFEANDLNKGKALTKKSQVLLTQWKSPELRLTKDEISSFAFQYNTSFDKEIFYASFLSDGLSFYKKSGYNGFDTLLISYYKMVFQDNPFLLDILLKDFPNMSEEERKKVIMLNAFMQRVAFDKEMLSSQELIYQSYIYGEFDFNFKPYEGDFASSVDMEVLWGEFFARGNYRPIERLLQAYEYKAQADYAMKVLRKELPEPSNASEELSLSKGRFYILVDSYFSSYITSPVLQRYLAWTLENTDSANIKEALTLLLGA